MNLSCMHNGITNVPTVLALPKSAVSHLTACGCKKGMNPIGYPNDVITDEPVLLIWDKNTFAFMG